MSPVYTLYTVGIQPFKTGHLGMSVSDLQNQNRLTTGPYISELNSVLSYLLGRNLVYLFTALIIYMEDILSHTTLGNNRPHERYLCTCLSLKLGVYSNKKADKQSHILHWACVNLSIVVWTSNYQVSLGEVVAANCNQIFDTASAKQ